jgi:outer membrane receptor for Fe3+-dicitrate
MKQSFQLFPEKMDESMKKKLLCSVTTLLLVIAGFAQKNVAVEASDDSILFFKEMPQIEIIGKGKDRLFRRIPGSVAVISHQQINTIVPVSGNDVMKKIPGLNVVDEEGAGLRINIGIRGLDPDRSRSVLILEDGIPVALNPYGEPELYFTPAIDKMKSVEV